MKSFILIFGSSGLLGSSLVHKLSQEYALICPTREDFSVSDTESIRKLINKTKPKAILNCLAFKNVDLAEKERRKADLANIIFLENLSTVIQENGCPLIHFSTDYVFDGQKGFPYNESDSPHPLNYYGKTKLLGEDIILKKLKHYFIIRTAWLYSHYGKNFYTFINSQLLNGSVSVVDDQIGSPTPVDFVSDGVSNLLHALFTKENFTYGLYHLTSGGSCSWYEFAIYIRNSLKFPISITPISSSTFKELHGWEKASRPSYSVLNSDKFSSMFNFKILKWQENFSLFLRSSRK